jgi:hypothetical protein
VYQSTESGKHEVYVCSFPTLDQKRQISSGGGSQPLWKKDGKELFYLTPNTKLMAVDVKSGASLETSNPRLLFQTPIEGNPVLAQYAVSGDGQRFLMIETPRVVAGSGIEQFQVELNWFADLRPKALGQGEEQIIPTGGEAIRVPGDDPKRQIVVGQADSIERYQAIRRVPIMV